MTKLSHGFYFIPGIPHWNVTLWMISTSESVTYISIYLYFDEQINSFQTRLSNILLNIPACSSDRHPMWRVEQDAVSDYTPKYLHWINFVKYGGILLSTILARLIMSACNMIMLKCELLISTCNIFMLTCNKIYKSPVNIIISHVNTFKLHISINKSHVNNLSRMLLYLCCMLT